MLDNLDLEEIKPSSRKYPGITFHQERDAGNQILSISGLSKDSSDGTLFKNINLIVNKGDRIAFVSKNSLAVTALFEILNGTQHSDSGEFTFGTTIKSAY